MFQERLKVEGKSCETYPANGLRHLGTEMLPMHGGVWLGEARPQGVDATVQIRLKIIRV